MNIPRETVALLRKYQVSQAMLQLANGDRQRDTGCLFTQDNGLPMNPRQYYGMAAEVLHTPGPDPY